jgi:hypothetical protein
VTVSGPLTSLPAAQAMSQRIGPYLLRA